MSYLSNEVPDALACSCYQCLSGEEVEMSDWLENPLHRKIHDQVRAALQRGDIHVQGEDDGEDASSMD